MTVPESAKVKASTIISQQDRASQQPCFEEEKAPSVKDTSETSDSLNPAESERDIEKDTEDSIEGCNENIDETSSLENILERVDSDSSKISQNNETTNKDEKSAKESSNDLISNETVEDFVYLCPFLGCWHILKVEEMKNGSATHHCWKIHNTKPCQLKRKKLRWKRIPAEDALDISSLVIW